MLKEAKFSGQTRKANALPSVGAGCARVGVVRRERARDGETLGTGDKGDQTFIKKPLLHYFRS